MATAIEQVLRSGRKWAREDLVDIAQAIHRVSVRWSETECVRRFAGRGPQVAPTADARLPVLFRSRWSVPTPRQRQLPR